MEVSDLPDLSGTNAAAEKGRLGDPTVWRLLDRGGEAQEV